MKQRLERWLLNVWYGDDRVGRYLLLPLTGLFCLLSRVNRWKQLRRQVKHPVPVVVVGNISVGGTGKTPLVIWLVEQLRELGFRPGVVSRGYGGGAAQNEPTMVSPSDSAADIGDEPLLIVQSTGVPLVVCCERNRAISTLLKDQACDMIITDDGLQHYRMGRDVEICVVDGQRRFGNGFCLPAGPLREPLVRLDECDFVVTNGGNMRMQGDVLVNIATGTNKPLAKLSGKTVHVVTGIGNPQRFIESLEQAGLRLISHFYPDHHAFQERELQFADDLPVLMTAKDAVKCRQFARENHWYLPVTAVLDNELADALLTRLQGFKHG